MKRQYLLDKSGAVYSFNCKERKLQLKLVILSASIEEPLTWFTWKVNAAKVGWVRCWNLRGCEISSSSVIHLVKVPIFQSAHWRRWVALWTHIFWNDGMIGIGHSYKTQYSRFMKLPVSSSRDLLDKLTASQIILYLATVIARSKSRIITVHRPFS